MIKSMWQTAFKKKKKICVPLNSTLFIHDLAGFLPSPISRGSSLRVFEEHTVYEPLTIFTEKVW